GPGGSESSEEARRLLEVSRSDSRAGRESFARTLARFYSLAPSRTRRAMAWILLLLGIGFQSRGHAPRSKEENAKLVCRALIAAAALAVSVASFAQDSSNPPPNAPTPQPAIGASSSAAAPAPP